MASVDTSSPVRSAGYGSFWNGKKWAETSLESDLFYSCLEGSYRAMRRSLNPGRRVWSPRPRNKWHDYTEWFHEHHPEADLIAGDEAPPFPGRVAYSDLS